MGVATPTPTEIIYAASAIDCEGCIGISCVRGRTYCPLIRVVQTRHFWLKRLQNVWGGRLFECSHQDKRRALKWQWFIKGKELVTLLEAIKPYLRIKNEQAELVLQLQKRIDHGQKHRRRLSQEERKVRRDLYQRCRLLNKTGPRGEQLSFEFKATSQPPLF